jgi:hypothetical protein
MCPFTRDSWLLIRIPLIWLLECWSLGGATVRVFVIYTHLEEKWQSKLINYPPPKYDPVEYFDSDIKQEINVLKKSLVSACVLFLCGIVAILMRACMSEN